VHVPGRSHLGLPGTYGTFGTMSKKTVVKNGKVPCRTGNSSTCEKSKVTFCGASRLCYIAGSALLGIPFFGFGISGFGMVFTQNKVYKRLDCGLFLIFKRKNSCNSVFSKILFNKIIISCHSVRKEEKKNGTVFYDVRNDNQSYDRKNVFFALPDRFR
jgi:hypothetical protein